VVVLWRNSIQLLLWESTTRVEKLFGVTKKLPQQCVSSARYRIQNLGSTLLERIPHGCPFSQRIPNKTRPIEFQYFLGHLRVDRNASQVDEHTSTHLSRFCKISQRSAPPADLSLLLLPLLCSIRLLFSSSSFSRSFLPGSLSAALAPLLLFLPQLLSSLDFVLSFFLLLG
jgi:hypothetical protein